MILKEMSAKLFGHDQALDDLKAQVESLKASNDESTQADDSLTEINAELNAKVEALTTEREELNAKIEDLSGQVEGFDEIKESFAASEVAKALAAQGISKPIEEEFAPEQAASSEELWKQYFQLPIGDERNEFYTSNREIMSGGFKLR